MVKYNHSYLIQIDYLMICGGAGTPVMSAVYHTSERKTNIMKFRRRMTSVLLLALILSEAVSCGSTPSEVPTDGTTTGVDIETSVDETTEDPGYVCDIPEEVKFDGETFTFAIYEDPNTNNHMLVDEEDGDTMNDAIYKRRIMTEERFGITLDELVYEDSGPKFRAPIMAGDNSYDIGNVRCTDALAFWQDGIITPVSELPYVDIDKSYWNRSFNDSLTLCHQQYIAIGDMMTSTHDLTYALAFNKNLAENYNIGDIYSLVRDGKWTFDAMFGMMKTATQDANGDTVMDENDRYGYCAHPKMVLPSFWIAAGEMSVKKDEDDRPYLAMGEERFMNVFARVFDMTYGAGTYYKPGDDDFKDVTDAQRKLFTDNRLLFMDCSFYYAQLLRSMETDFGIVPYPKYTEDQSRYYSRVSYYNAPVIPISNDRLELVGAFLEYFNWASSETVIPAYYDTVLYGKVVRDEESCEMLDLIFDSRVVDIGDTTMCSDIRDGVVRTMFRTKDNNLSSKLPSLEKVVNKFLKKMPE